MRQATKANHTVFLEFGGKKIQLLQGGEGPPLLYLHSAAGEMDWLPFHEDLAAQFHVHAPAHPGFSLSSGLEQIDDVTDMAWHYVDLLDVLGLERMPVVGFSLGAWIALELAILRPQRVEKLVLVAAAGLWIEGFPIADIFVDDVDELRELSFFDPADPAADLVLPSSPDDPRMLLHFRAREAAARVGWNPYMHNPSLEGQLHRIECPTLVIWGREDRIVPMAHGELLARKIPKARLAVLDNCGHMLPLERPEEFAGLVTSFLSP
jgi:pimeloyl-ACP methyl ester carboxylesterase